MGLWPAWNRYNAATWSNRRIHDKIDKSHRNADVYADISKAAKKLYDTTTVSFPAVAIK